jgi:HK97 gp10 family phage protein
MSLSNEDKQKIKQEVLRIGLYALRRAKQRAPVDTGRLRASITLADSDGLVQPLGGDGKEGDSVDSPRGEFVVRIGTNVEYARFQEFGTENQAAQPFLRPGLDDALNRFNAQD